MFSRIIRNMETLRIIEHGNGHTDIEALIYGEWVVVKCIDSNKGELPMTVIKYENIRTAIREVEKHIKAMTSDRAEQIAVISKAQSLTIDNEHNIAVLAIAKNRIIRAR